MESPLCSRVLVVDDAADQIFTLTSVIAAPDVEIVSATSGEEALEQLQRHDVALAIIDIEMPGMNGLELARLIRNTERNRSIPIVFVTAANRDAASRFEGYERGAIGFLTKPLDFHLVRNKVRVFVDLDQRTRILREKLVENEALRKAAEEANRAKSRFLANMTHEIRTPLGAVLGFAELLKGGDHSRDEMLECIEAIERNGNLLSQLIDDVLDLAKIEAERTVLEDQELSLAEFVRDLRAIHGLKAREKGIEFRVVLEGQLPRDIRTDGTRLKQAASNVIGNAIKFTASGFVEVSLTAERQGVVDVLRLTVKDTGCGLSADEQARLFQPFVQADSSTTRRFGGSGLGLAISRRLARLLGGDLVISESAKDQGSVFSLSVAIGAASDRHDWLTGEALLAEERRPLAHVSNTELAGRTLLVVDDANDIRELLRRSLCAAGARVEIARNGAEALAAARRQDFDAVVMDMQMPVMDGCEATRTLRRDGYAGLVVGLTAHAAKDQLDAARESGCNLCLSKPAKRPLLVAAIKKGLGGCGLSPRPDAPDGRGR